MEFASAVSPLLYHRGPEKSTGVRFCARKSVSVGLSPFFLWAGGVFHVFFHIGIDFFIVFLRSNPKKV